MNNIESLKQRILNLYRPIARGSEAHNAEQRNWAYQLQQVLSPLLTYRPTPPSEYWLDQESKLGTKFRFFNFSLLGVASSITTNLSWELLGLLLSGTGLAIFAYSCLKRALDMTRTPPSLEVLFKVELEQSINIKEFEKEVLQVEQENKRKLEELVSTPESALKTYVAEIMHLVAEGESKEDLLSKVEKFSKAEELAWNLATASNESSFNELYELSKNYARTLSAAQLFFKSVHLMNLAKAAKNNKNQAEELLYRTEAFDTLTKIHSLKWAQCPLSIRKILHISANQLLVSDVFEERTFISELKLRLRMLLPSIKLFKDIVGNYRKSKKNYIQSILILSEIDNPFKDIEDKVRKVLENEEKIDSSQNQLPESFSNQSQSNSWEEESEFINMLIDDMEEARNTEAPKEEIEAFEKILKKFIE